MNKLLIFPILFFFLFSGCGSDPKPQKNSLEALREKMSHVSEDRFKRDGSNNRSKKKSGLKHKDDPTAYVYKGKVLSPKAEAQWKDVGIDNVEYPQWAVLKMQPKEVSAWKALDISYAAIRVFKENDYSHKKAKKFLQKKFFTRPVFYARFGTPVYEFDSICRSVVKRQQAPFAFLEEQCLPYMKEAHKNESIGHLLDEAQLTKGPLVIEYLAELRRLAENNTKIQSGMEVTIEEFVEDEDTDNFVFLFPLLQNEPTKEEMDFIDVNKLPLQDEERFFSFQNPLYWKNRAAAEAAAAEHAASQEALLRAKKEKDRQEAKLRLARAEALSKEKARKQAEYKRNKMAQKAERIRRIKVKSICGMMLKPDQLSGKPAFIDGEIMFTVGKQGKKMFGYGVRAFEDGKVYFIRDPKNMAKSKVSKSITWKVKTMGRTEALTKASKRVYKYDKKSKTKYTMALLVKECKVK